MVTPKISNNAQGHHERHTLTLLRGPFLIRSLQIKTDDMYSTHFFFVDAFLQQSTAALVREPLNHIIILRCDIVMVSCNGGGILPHP